MRRNAQALIVATLVGLVTAAVQSVVQPLNSLDTFVHDLALAARPPESYLGPPTRPGQDPRDIITIVAIDERTIDELGAYNGGYPRRYHAAVIENLLAAPPRVIAFDLGFFEPTADDALLADALTHARSLPVPTSVILSAAGLVTPGKALNGAASGEVTFDRLLQPVPELVDRAELALANVMPDERGTIRSMPLLALAQGVERPSLGLAATARYLRRPAAIDDRADGTLVLAGRRIPVDQQLTTQINFFGPPSAPYTSGSTFRVVSFTDVLNNRLDPGIWRGGLVFIGALGATGLADDYWTPASDRGRKMAGVEIHANVAATLLSTNFLTQMPQPGRVGLTVAVAVLVGLISANAGVVLAGASLSVVLTALLGLVAWLLYAYGLLSPLGAPAFAGLMAFVLELGPRLAAEQRQARAVRVTLDSERRFDRLTGLSNRTQLTNNLAAAISSAEVNGHSLAIILVDIDRLRDVNDTLGHRAGDDLLKAVAARLGSAPWRAGTQLARLGGDVFAILVPQTDAQLAMRACEALARVLETPVRLAGQDTQVAVTASFGIAAYPVDGHDPETLLRRADVALNAAKQTRTASAVFRPDQELSSAQRLRLVNELRHAIAHDELLLYYQPKINCATGRLAGVEALVRWQHPRDGLLTPDSFVLLAEETGLIGPLSRWVLRAGIAQARAWMQAGLTVRVAMNLSACDLQDVTLPRFVGDLLEEYAVPPPLISLEITESALLANPDRALDILSKLDAQGIHACLDDFGTGYSSLTYVRRWPLHELKIDASFVRDLVRSSADRTIVQSTIELAHRLGLVVVAEGVEDEQTLSELRALGCDQAQGFFLSRPLAGGDLADWARESRSAAAASVQGAA